MCDDGLVFEVLYRNQVVGSFEYLAVDGHHAMGYWRPGADTSVSDFLDLLHQAKQPRIQLTRGTPTPSEFLALRLEKGRRWNEDKVGDVWVLTIGATPTITPIA